VKYLKVWKLGVHTQVAIAIVVGITLGLLIQLSDADPHFGAVTFEERTVSEGADAGWSGLVVTKVDKADKKKVQGDIQVGDRLVSIGKTAVSSLEQLEEIAAETPVGMAVALTLSRPSIAALDEREKVAYIKADMGSQSDRAAYIRPFDYIAQLFLRLLQMLIVPLIVTSMITGVASIGDPKSLGRLGFRTFIYYVITSMLAILVGFVLVSLIQPGTGAEIPLNAEVEAQQFGGEGNPFADILLRMVPQNVGDSLTNNGMILQVIFFSLLFGVFISKVGGEHGEVLLKFFQAGFEVMMRVAQAILSLVPIGVVALLARVVGISGLDVFKDLLMLMLTVVLALGVHVFITLPLILWFVGRVNPLQWAKAVWPALLMAFSTSSSSITLPVTMKAVEERGGASNKVSSFVLPLGATINMDGTALYECVGVIFLAQFYAGASGFELTLGMQITVVFTALLASVGAAGIPSAGLVMMTTILSALGLPLEGTFLLLAIDRPLDMLRTATNIWSDTTCVAVMARLEGDSGIAGAKGGGAAESTPTPVVDQETPPETEKGG